MLEGQVIQLTSDIPYDATDILILCKAANNQGSFTSLILDGRSFYPNEIFLAAPDQWNGFMAITATAADTHASDFQLFGQFTSRSQIKLVSPTGFNAMLCGVAWRKLGAISGSGSGSDVDISNKANLYAAPGKTLDDIMIGDSMNNATISWEDVTTVAYPVLDSSAPNVPYITFSDGTYIGYVPTSNTWAYCYADSSVDTSFVSEGDSWNSKLITLSGGLTVTAINPDIVNWDFFSSGKIVDENPTPIDVEDNYTAIQELKNTTFSLINDSNTALKNKSDIYNTRPELSTLKVGDDIGGMFINFDIPDFDFNEDADGGYAQYDAITFSDGSRIRFENSSWYYMAAQVGISLPNIIHTIVEGGNYWTDSSFTLPDGLTITAVDPRWADSPMSKGHLQSSSTDTTGEVVDCEYNYKALQNHILNDQGYWQTLLKVQNTAQATQTLLMDTQTTIQSLLNRVAVLENTPAPDPEPVYDMANPEVLKTPPLLGLLGIEVGGANNIGSGWTAPVDGLIVVDGASSIGLLTPEWIAVDGEKVAPSGSTTVLTLIGGGSSGKFTIEAGQVLTESGMGNVTYYREVT